MPTRMKGSFLVNFGTGGFSESLYAVDNTNMTYAQMTQAMLTLKPLRSALSYVGSVGGILIKCLNPADFLFVRVEDELKNKDSLLTKTTNSTGYVPGSVPNDLYNQNLYQNQVAKVQWNGQGLGQQVSTYIRAIPVAATDDNLADQASISELHFTPMNAIWLSNLQAYAHGIRAQGLGFRFLDSPWDTNGTPNGNALPSAVTYNPVSEQYEFTMPLAAPQFKMRYVLRGFKSLNFLNGRWPGIDLGALKIRILRKARNVAWDGQGFVSPEVWNYFKPNETLPNDPAQLPGAKYFFMTEKKLGRPFGLPRGRLRAKQV